MNAPKLFLVRELSVLDELTVLNGHPIRVELERNGFVKNGRCTFVGVFYSAETDSTVIGYPKYLPVWMEDDVTAILSHVDLICRVVEQAQPYLNQSLFDAAYRFDEYRVSDQARSVNRYDLANLILLDYLTYGIYCCKTTQIVRNGNGPINWNRTIQGNALLLGREVIYLDTYHSQGKLDDTQLVTELHAWIVFQCARMLQGIGQYRELELPEIKTRFDAVELSQFTPYLMGRLTSVFSDRETRLLKALSSWCGQTFSCSSQMGVTVFDRIWEYAVKEVFGNVEDTRSGPPSYFIKGEKYRARGDAIPDILRVFRYGEEGCNVIGILDAKYYCPQLNAAAHVIEGAPANSDIAKQIGYLHYIKQLYPQEDNEFTNAFLFPGMLDEGEQEQFIEQVGYASPNDKRYDEIDRLLQIGSSMPLSQQDRVLLFKINPRLLFEACLRRKKVDEHVFYDRFIKPFHQG